MAQALLSILSISVGIATACDFETLVTECTPPTGIQDSAYCGQFVVYEECASNAGCLTVRSVTKVLDSARYRTACEGGSAAAPRPTAPRVTTSGGNFYLNGKKVCFSEEGAETVCAAELALKTQIDDVLVKQGVLADNLEQARKDIVQIVDANLVPLKADLKTANELAAEQSTMIESIQEELEGNCGKHCYPGNYVKTPCTETTKTACAACQDGTFSPGGLGRFCPKCKVCSPRQFQTADCSLTRDTGCTGCTPCPDGKYAPLKDGKACADKSTSHCAAHAVCSKTQFTQKVGNPWDNTLCTDCATCEDGKFAFKPCDAKTNTVCKVCKKCAGGQLLMAACTATKDTVCVAKQKSCKALQDLGFEEDGMYSLTIGWTYCILNKDIGGGGWHLAMNIHPNDKHSAAWAAKLKDFKPGGKNYVESNKPTWWAGDIQYSPAGLDKAPWGADYKSMPNNKVAAKEMLIVRHKDQEGSVLSNKGDQHFVWRRWKFTGAYQGKNLLYIYRNTFRSKLTDDVAEENLYGNARKNCPVFGYNGNIYVNFYYSNNGARLILDGQSLSAQSQNDDSSFGLGMEFSSHQGNKRFSGSSGDWCYDAAYAESPSGSGNAQGNDSCHSLKRNNNYLGEYAIFVR